MARTFEDLWNSKEADDTYTYYDDSNFDNDMRIVGGVDAPEPVPWYTLLRIDTKKGKQPGSRCGATLISNR